MNSGHNDVCVCLRERVRGSGKGVEKERARWGGRDTVTHSRMHRQAALPSSPGLPVP